MSFVSQLPLIRQYLTRYGMTTYTALGNIGLLLNIATFIQPQQRRIPCSLYILVASVCGLIGLNLSVLPVIYALDHFDLLTSSVYVCYLQFYFRHAFNQMMPWILRIYKFVTQVIRKSSERQNIETFLFYLGNVFLLFSNNSFSFWIYLCASPSFRLKLKNLLIKCYAMITGQQR